MIEPTAENRDESPSLEQHEEQQLRSLIEATIFASPEPVLARQLARALREPEERIQQLVEQIVEEFQKAEHGVTVRQVNGGYRMSTKAQHEGDLKEILRGLRPRVPLSVPALQTLAIIAYKQPVSASDIQKIRRVDGAGVLDTLLKRHLIAPAGRKNEGRNALLYKTTDLFLKDFGLMNLKDLPALEEFAEVRESYDLDSPAAELRKHQTPSTATSD